MNYGIPQPNPLRMQQPMQQGAPQQAGTGWPSVGQALGGIFSKDLLPMYLGMAMGGTKNAQAQLASQGAQAANDLELSRNQMAQQQAQFAQNLGFQREQQSALEAYRRAQMDMDRQGMAFRQRAYDDEQRRLNENPFTKGINQIGEIPDQYLGGPNAAPVVRQMMINNMLKIGQIEADVEGEGKLRKEIASRPEFRNAELGLNSYKRMAAAAEGGTAADDVALLFNYMKMLDPTSVVREAEYATISNIGSVPENVWRSFLQARDGNKLTPEMRGEILTAASNQAGVYADQMNGLIQYYKPITQQYGYNPSRVLPQPADISQTKQSLDTIKQRYGLE